MPLFFCVIIAPNRTRHKKYLIPPNLISKEYIVKAFKRGVHMNKNELIEYADYLLQTALYKVQNIADAEELV